MRHMSVYSIARFLHLSPLPPLRLGGWFWREGGSFYLSDCQTRFELKGPPSLFFDLKNGAIAVDVEIEQAPGLASGLGHELHQT